MINEEVVSSGTEEKTVNLLWNAIVGGATLKEINGVPDSVMEGIYAYAYEFYQAGRLDDAESCFRFLCLYDTYNAEYLMGLAATLQQKEQYQNAIDVYALMFVLAKSDFRSVLHTGQCYLFLRNTEQARECFSRILRSDAPASIKAKAEAYARSIKPVENSENSHV